MPNVIRSGVSWLAGQLKTHAGESVTYQRGASSVTLTATRIAKEYEVADASGFPERLIAIDWTLTAAELLVASVQREPRPGDLIIDGDGEKYELMPVGTAPCFEPHDSAETMLLLHTKRIY